jgi:hypothetical protein
LPFGEPQPADRLAIGLDHEDEVPWCVDPERQDRCGVGLGLADGRFVGLAALVLDTVRVACLGGSNPGGELVKADGSQAESRFDAAHRVLRLLSFSDSAGGIEVRVPRAPRNVEARPAFSDWRPRPLCWHGP